MSFLRLQAQALGSRPGNIEDIKKQFPDYLTDLVCSDLIISTYKQINNPPPEYRNNRVNEKYLYVNIAMLVPITTAIGSNRLKTVTFFETIYIHIYNMFLTDKTFFEKKDDTSHISHNFVYIQVNHTML